MDTVRVKLEEITPHGHYRLAVQGGLVVCGRVLQVHRGLVRLQLDDADFPGMWLRFPLSWVYKAWRVW